MGGRIIIRLLTVFPERREKKSRAFSNIYSRSFTVSACNCWLLCLLKMKAYREPAHTKQCRVPMLFSLLSLSRSTRPILPSRAHSSKKSALFDSTPLRLTRNSITEFTLLPKKLMEDYEMAWESWFSSVHWCISIYNSKIACLSVWTIYITTNSVRDTHLVEWKRSKKPFSAVEGFSPLPSPTPVHFIKDDILDDEMPCVCVLVKPYMFELRPIVSVGGEPTALAINCRWSKQSSNNAPVS